MSRRLKTLTREQVNSTNQQLYDKLKEKVGRVPNLYAIYANSPVALKANLEFAETLKSGTFNDKEVEAVALSVSEENGCDYCLAAHTAVGKMAGLSEDETVEIREGSIDDPKLKAISRLSRQITATRGRPSEQELGEFFDAGYDEAALVELIGLVALNTFNNYINHIAETEVDFPAPPQLVTA